ncbi:hypothetical protein M9H77_35598 [Catharanthus roseus]|uniref:Uncharacterized protein n=1 Tax=Catharanthus roseus TaxID=4058 RepID=A0ACB9ZPT0_CATRO|nr:hypothetical protein M9H77_35598 [Catharanthus roseus]
MDAHNFQPLHSVGESCIPTTKNLLYSKFSSIPCPLVSTARLKQYLHFLNDVRHRYLRIIYRVQGSLELSFFRVIVIIRFRLTRNGIISVQSINLIIVVIDGSVQYRRKTYDALRSMKAPSLSFEHSRDWDPYLDISIFSLQVRYVKSFGSLAMSNFSALLQEDEI